VKKYLNKRINLKNKKLKICIKILKNNKDKDQEKTKRGNRFLKNKI
jgi:hypothetical protein